MRIYDAHGLGRRMAKKSTVEDLKLQLAAKTQLTEKVQRGYKALVRKGNAAEKNWHEKLKVAQKAASAASIVTVCC